MRTFVLTLVAFVLGAGLLLAQAGSMLVPYTAGHRSGLEFGLAAYNANNPDAQKQLQEYGQEVCQVAWGGYERRRNEFLAASAGIEEKYFSLDDAEKAQVEALIDSLISS